MRGHMETEQWIGVNSAHCLFQSTPAGHLTPGEPVPSPGCHRRLHSCAQTPSSHKYPELRIKVILFLKDHMLGAGSV